MAGKGGFIPGSGRKPGVPNKITGDLKAMILGALDKAGGIDYLHAQSSSNPAAFMTLIGKVLPLQVTGHNNGPVMVITGVMRAEDDDEHKKVSDV